MLPAVSGNKDIPNPEYNPDWERIHDERKAQYDEIAEEMSYVYSTSQCTDEQIESVTQRLAAAQDAYHATFRMQHETVQDYGRWMFQNFPIYTKNNGSQPIIPDVSRMKSMADVSKEWNEIHAIAEKMKMVENKSMPAKSHGIFSNETVASYRRDFNTCGVRVSALVTTEQDNGRFHVCFMQDPEAGGRSVTNAVEDLATTIYREAEEILKPKGISRIFGRSALSPDQFDFFVHIPPECGIREAFSKIDMGFKHGRFVSPQWTQLDAIPLSVQQARFAVSNTNAPPAAAASLSAPGPHG